MASGIIKKAIGSKGYELRVNWSSAVSTSVNSSTVTCKISLYCPYSLRISARSDNTIYINGRGYNFDTAAIDTEGGTIQLATVTSSLISHNADGTKAISIDCIFKLNATISGTYYGNISAAGTATLDNIDKATVPTVSSSGTIGKPISISFTGMKSTYRHELKYKFKELSGTIISTLGSKGTYNWTIPTTFYAQIPNSQSDTCEIELITYSSGGAKIGSYVRMFAANIDKADCAPTMNPDVMDVDSYTPYITSDNSIFIKGISDASCYNNAAARRSATIKSAKITCGKQTVSGNSARFADIEEKNITFSVTDSRGLTTTQTITLNMIEYKDLTANLSCEQMTTDGTLSFSYKVNVWQGNFGSTPNTIWIRYRYAPNGTEMYETDWIDIVPDSNVSGTEYSGKITIPNLDYRTNYQVDLMAVDLMTPRIEKSVFVKALPVFDWGKENFHIHGSLYVDDVVKSEDLNLTNLAKAHTTNYTLTSSTSSLGANYTSVGFNAQLTGGVLRCTIFGARTAELTGNDVTNEKICTITINHGGKIANTYHTTFCNGSSGGIAQFYTTNSSKPSANELKFDIYLGAIGGTFKQYNTYFILPVTLNLDAEW